MPIRPATYVTAPEVNMAAEAVRRRVRARWERRRAATAGHTVLSIQAPSPRGLSPTRRAATIADTNLCLANPAFAERRYALVEKVGR